MIDRTLVVGCSYVSNIRMQSEKFLIGTPGSGNTAIAANLLATLANRKLEYDSVVVLWSGINRLDCPVNLEYHSIFGNKEKYPFFTQIGNIVWYHSGGVIGSWQDSKNYNCPRAIQDYFTMQYKGATPRYLTDLSLREIASVQRYLESCNIKYKMGFIYDIHKEYDKQHHVHLESVCGQVDTNSMYYPLVDWSKFEKRSPYEWCLDRGLIGSDGWHWTINGANQWFKEVLDINLFDLT